MHGNLGVGDSMTGYSALVERLSGPAVGIDLNREAAQAITDLMAEVDRRVDLKEELCAVILNKDFDIKAAHNAAIEEAAKVAEKYPTEILNVYSRGSDSPPGNQMVRANHDHIAGAIRELKK